jgi:hypothetical protein
MTNKTPLETAFLSLLEELSKHHDMAKRDVERACSAVEAQKVGRAAQRYAEELAGRGWDEVFSQLFPEGYDQDTEDSFLLDGSDEGTDEAIGPEGASAGAFVVGGTSRARTAPIRPPTLRRT